ncbi:hypothetical protein OG21DRAFT_1521987 [Imleria badia]|nr:hypothetical protein OG21DRAFT_1521987 [Imleria badia]
MASWSSQHGFLGPSFWILEGPQAIQSAYFVDEKQNSAELVTAYDVVVENVVMTDQERVPELSLKRAVLGVVYNPFSNYLPTVTPMQYTAIEGQGSSLTRGSGQPMKLPLTAPKPLPSLSKAPIADPVAAERGWMVHTLRTTGSGALNFCLVAYAAIDVCW